MPDGPTTRPVYLHHWLRWRERPARGGKFADLQIAVNELYDFGLWGIVEIVGAAQPPGLLDMGAHVIAPQTIELLRPELIELQERDGAKTEINRKMILVPRARGGGGLSGGLGGGCGPSQYGDLRFRLAEPAEFAKYIADPSSFRPRHVISRGALVYLLLEDEAFQQHRDKKFLPSERLLKQVAELRYPDFDFPRDNALRQALIDDRVAKVYGPPRAGPPPKWARVIR